jgi:collagen beta-1,O-galactosyltransferase
MGNDFGNRKGVIGCALSHYYLWKQLIADSLDYYVILEDDITVTNDFKTKIEKIKEEKCDLCFLGYHMYSKDRNASYDEKDGYSVQAFQKDLFVGGTFGYFITKRGAQKMLDYVEKHGIKHGIDYVIKIASLDFIETVN